ncbi:MAG: DUF255 domain-containing protein [Bacteroidales bacterium]|nr:DUF255 domain-containing protein [Bacteroidales bacterium]
MKTLLTITLLILSNLYLLGQEQDTVLEWLSFEETNKLFLENQKPVMIFLYSENEEQSLKMQNETFGNPEVAKYINALFYPIKLDVFSKDTLQFFNGQYYIHEPKNKFHSLASMLTADSVVYPALVVFDKYAQGNVFYGFKNRDSIFPILIYYYEELFKSVEYQEWESIYLKTYPPGQKQIITSMKIHWLTIDEMKEQLLIKPKPILIDIYDNYSVSSTVMRLYTYNNAEIAKYLNEKFYCVNVNLRSEEEFELKGVTYKNSGPPFNYQQFAYAVLQGNLTFPAFVILDEELNLLERIQIFLTPEKLDPIIHFYGENIYKTQDYKSFLNNYSKLKTN